MTEEGAMQQLLIIRKGFRKKKMRKMPGRQRDHAGHSKTISSPHCTDPAPESSPLNFTFSQFNIGSGQIDIC